MLGRSGILGTTCGSHILVRATRNVRRWLVVSAGVSKAVNGIKDLPRPLPGDHWSRLACRDVAEDGAVIKMDIVEAKASDGSFVCGDFL